MRLKLPREWGVAPVPPEQRILGSLDLAVLWSSLGVGLLVIAAGALLVPALSLPEAIIAIVVGSVAGSILLGLTGVIGTQTGVPTMVALRPAFGYRGSFLPTVLNIVQLVGWTAFEITIMARSANLISGSVIGFKNFWLWILIFTGIVVLMGFGGPILVVRQWMEKFAIWLVVGISIWIFYVLLHHITAQSVLLQPGHGGISFPLAVDLVIAMPVSWMPLAADYNRFGRSETQSFFGTLTGYALSNAWFYALGALLVLAMATSDIVAAIASIGFGLPALLVILVDETDNGFADVYSASVSTQNLSANLKQKPTILGYAAMGAFLAWILPLEEYASFLLMIGALFVPLFGVILTDYYVLCRGNYEEEELLPRDSTKINLRPRAFLSWLIGATTYFALANFAPEIGATLPSLVVASGFYMVLSYKQLRTANIPM